MYISFSLPTNSSFFNRLSYFHKGIPAASMATTTSPPATGPLNFISLNPKGSSTVLLVHGGLSNHQEWVGVSKSVYMADYHLLIPDLPLHGNGISSKISFNIPDAAALLADLIEKHAKGGKAHVAALSLGGYTSFFLASRYPDRVLDLVITGCGNRRQHSPFVAAIIAHFVSISMWIALRLLPKSVFLSFLTEKGIPCPDYLYDSVVTAQSRGVVVQMVQSVAVDITSDDWTSVKARTLLTAGSADDPIELTRETGQLLRVGCKESRAAVLIGRKHAWNATHPDLFAAGVKAWIDRRQLPVEFELLL
jgi:pimeloyl-ACP methyl ester carboxylesterase